MAFAYDSYTNPSKNNGVLRTTLTSLAEKVKLLRNIIADCCRDWCRDLPYGIGPWLGFFKNQKNTTAPGFDEVDSKLGRCIVVLR